MCTSKDNSISTKNTPLTQEDEPHDPFHSEDNEKAWPHPFASHAKDPFASSGDELNAKVDDPWSAFANNTTQVFMVCYSLLWYLGSRFKHYQIVAKSAFRRLANA